MKRIFTKIICLILILFSVIQVQINSKFAREKEKMNSITDTNKNTSIKYKTLSKLNNELSCLKMCKFIGANNDGEKWKVKIKMGGDRKSILSEMINLKKYEITSYRIVKNNDENFIILEMFGIQ